MKLLFYLKWKRPNDSEKQIQLKCTSTMHDATFHCLVSMSKSQFTITTDEQILNSITFQ